MQIFVKAVRDAIINLTISETRRFGRPTKLLFERFDKFETMLNTVFFGEDALMSPLGLKWRRCGREGGLCSAPPTSNARVPTSECTRDLTLPQSHVATRRSEASAR